MSQHDDPPEFVGADDAIKADPVAGVSRDTPMPVVDVGTDDEPVKKSHPKIAHARPAAQYRAAQEETLAARTDLIAANAHARRCRDLEGEALVAWIKANPAPSADTVYREHVARSQTERAERVNAGLSPDAPTGAPKIGRSPLDQHAFNRGRQSQVRASTPLRSNISRR